MMKTFDITFRFAGVLLCTALLLFSCSKKGDKPSARQLVLEASSADIDEGDEVTFTVTAGGETVDADIYVDNSQISGTKHKFTKSGVYSVTAKREGYFDSDAEEVKVHQVDVYVAGKATMAGVGAAVYWKNGTLKTLSKISAGSASARSIFVKNDDVYVAGYAHNGTNDVATFWKNGVATDLSGGKHAYANSIFVNHDDVYVAGEQAGVIYYWKNGMPFKFTDKNSNSFAIKMDVDNDVLYVAGYEWNGSKFVAKYWKNGTATDLSDGSQNSYARSIFIDNGDVYVAGFEDKGSKNVAKYWKNGTATDLSDGSKNAVVYSIVVADGDVYVAGYEDNGSKKVAKYWKNGKAIDLSDGNENAIAYSIDVANGDVYVAGYENNGLKDIAKYWKNGKAVELDVGDFGTNADARSILVTRTLKD